MLYLMNYFVCKLMHPLINLKGANVYNFWLRGSKGNEVNLIHNKIHKTRLNIKGYGNKVNLNQSLVSDTLINIIGNRNVINVEKGVKLRKAEIIIIGNNCKIEIQHGTTFGSIKIVNAGTNNTMLIGKNGLFADHVEIWASDTHAIFDEHKNWINKEKPISIGNNVWIGSHVKILKGVNVADGAILGMGTLITKDVPKNVIVAGSPMRVIKEKVSWSLDYPIEE